MWNYRVVKTNENGQDCFKIVEVYYDKETGKVTGWAPTSYTTALLWEEFDDLKYTVEHIVEAMKKPILLHVPEDDDALVEMQRKESMTDQEKKIAQIREALEKADNGLWVPQEDCPNCRGNGSQLQELEDGSEFNDCYCLIPDNRMFNANAPEWLRFLLSELERKDKDIDMFINQAARELEAANRNWKEKCEENRKLREELDGWKDHRSELVIKNTELLGKLRSAQQTMEQIRGKLLDIFSGIKEIEEESRHNDACIKINDIARYLIEEFGVAVR